MNPNAVLKFLQSLRSLAKSGVIKSVDQAMDFAKREFGEVTDLFKRQIEQVFKKPVDKAPKPGEGGITSIKNAPKKETPDQESGISFSIPEKGIIRQKASIEEITDMIKNNPYRPKKGLDPVEGMTRTAARVVLDRYGIKYPEKADPINVFEENFGGNALMDLKDVGEELLEKEVRGKITESMGEFLESRGMFDLKINKDAPKGMTDDELIKKLTEDVDQEDIDKAIEQENILLDFDPKGRKPSAEGGINRVAYRYGSGKSLIKFLKGKNNLIKKIKQAVDDIFPTGDSKYDADVAVDTMFEELGVDRDMFDQKEVLDAYGLAYDELRKPLLEKIKNKPKPSPKKTEQEEMEEFYKLNEQPSKEFTIKDMRPMKLLKPISESQVDAIIENIKKLDPLDAMKEVNKVVKRDGFYKDLSDKQSQKIFDDTQDHIFEKDIKPGSKPIKQGDPITSENFGESQFAPDTSDLEKAKILDDVDEAYGIAPKMVERFQLKERFPGIDDRLLTQIIDDPDPQNKAEAISTLDQAMELTKQGKDPDEVISILEKIKKSRRDNSKGGLQYLMGM